MNRLIGCLIGGAVHQPFEGNVTTAHIISTDLSQIYVAAPLGQGRWNLPSSPPSVSASGFGSASSPSASDLRAADQDFVKASKPGAVTGLMAEGDRR
jgi:hypothetical protein